VLQHGGATLWLAVIALLAGLRSTLSGGLNAVHVMLVTGSCCSSLPSMEMFYPVERPGVLLYCIICAVGCCRAVNL
jgi:hypothetical protein